MGRARKSRGEDHDPHEASVFDWIRRNEGRLKDGDIDILLDLTGERSALGAPPDAEELGSEAAWVRESGVTPLEFLVRVYRHPLQKPSDRIAAARAVLEYAHKRTQRLELGGELTTKKFDPAAMAKLSQKELDQMVALLEKLEKA